MRIRRIILAVGLQCLLAVTAQAADYPDRPIRLIVPFAPGGTANVIAQPLAKKLGELLGTTVIVMARGGSGGVVGTAEAAKAKNDGYTLILGSNGAMTIAQHLGPLPYDPIKDFDPVGMVATSQFVVVTHPSVPARNIKELVELAKNRKDKLTYGSAGVGSVGHLATELFDSMAGVDMVHVPYTGTGPMTVDLLAGRIDLAVQGLPSLLPNIKAGNLKALAVTSKKRSSLMPDVPTVDEAGVKGYDVVTFWALFAPAGTPRPIIDKLNATLRQALRTDELRKTYLDTSNDPVESTPEELAQFIDEDVRKWGEIVRKSGI
jgi:tripartite-type tricarboxylate transporter receptor subunit TctC